MKLKNNSKPPRTPLKSGTYYGICVHAIDIGDQKDSFKTNGDYVRKFLWVFELFRLENFKMVPVTYEEDGITKPFDISVTLKSSQHMNSNVAKHLQSWLDEENIDEEFMKTFDTNEVVGLPAMLKVKLKENGYNDITAINPLPEGFPIPEASLPLIRFDMEPWSLEAFEALPNWAQSRIRKSLQYQKQYAPITDVAVQQPQQQTGVAPF